ncbi:hypothetical protein [Prauserella muralis]|uniref:Uncharacterized protein n=1 Tax=Prauserella muralis TaxID=588067 RepID=A0A2V4B1V7_9PSEU|nr:hypothetical protein [Prauserella muralis]PXY28251.1 hypothetical protein BAY60_18180 [Prauserella muralis]TWE27417.1 hypothetical protein FHX69_0040 [Prauserella muralis]
MVRAHRSLIGLAAIAVLATGMAAQALAAPAGVWADVRLATSLLLLTVSLTLAGRVLRYLGRRPPPS